MRRHLALVTLAVALATTSPVAAGARVYVQIGPPAPIVEARVLAPGPHYIWIAGFHQWNGHAYVWVPGHWVVPPAHRQAWVPGHWVHHPHHGWYWVEGHWR